MLQTIRDRAQGWIAWAIVLLISIPFVLWGIESYLHFGGEPIAVTVNGEEISSRDLDRRVEQARAELRERLGAAYETSGVDDARLRSEVLDDMVREILLRDASQRIGLRVADQEIQARILSEPAFLQDGRFDREAYARILRLQGLTPPMFEAQLRQQMTGSQLIRAVVASEFATRSESSDYQRLSDQKRDISYVRFPVSEFQSDTPVTDEEVQAYYKAHSAQFQSPEQVKVDYVVVDAAVMADKVTISDEAIRKAYDSDSKRFMQDERRKVSHILLPVAQDADKETADKVLKDITALREKIVAGGSFEDIAKADSKDPGSAAKGGSLGIVERGVMVPAFEQAAFSQKVAEISEPVRTQFGYHLIRVDEVLPAQVRPFDEVKDQLRSELAKQQADSQFYDQGERLANLLYESSGSLEPAANELGLTIQHSDWISRSGGEGILAEPKVVAAAFSDDVLNEGRNSDLIEPERDKLRAIALRVVDRRPASTKPLEEVKSQIVDEIKKERAQKGAVAAAEALAEKLKKGEDWATLLGTRKAEAPGLVDRRAPAVPELVRDLAFKLTPPGEKAPAIGTTQLDDGDAVVVRVTKVEDGKVAAGTTQGDDSSMLARVLGRQMFTDMLSDLESRAKIERQAAADAKNRP